MMPANAVNELPLPRERKAPFLIDDESLPTRIASVNRRDYLHRAITRIVDKPRPSPSGNPRDYVSYGQYWWPDSSRPDGRPFVRRDGDFNHEWMRMGDRARYLEMLGTIEHLAGFWQVSRDQDCAMRAGEWIKTWFIDPSTAMTPCLQYSQVRLGHDGDNGSDAGVLDGTNLLVLLESLRLLQGSSALSDSELAVLRDWFSRYVHWLETSVNGRAEHAARNNHGTWYLVQITSMLLFLGRHCEAAKYCAEDYDRIGWQFEPDGRQPLELARADGLSYSQYNLHAQFHLAHVASQVGVDLWNFVAPGGASLRSGLRFVAPYDGAPHLWPFNQKKKLEAGIFSPLLEIGRHQWPDESF